MSGITTDAGDLLTNIHSEVANKQREADDGDPGDVGEEFVAFKGVIHLSQYIKVS